jgi:hypothetical protein
MTCSVRSASGATSPRKRTTASRPVDRLVCKFVLRTQPSLCPFYLSENETPATSYRLTKTPASIKVFELSAPFNLPIITTDPEGQMKIRIAFIALVILISVTGCATTGVNHRQILSPGTTAYLQSSDLCTPGVLVSAKHLNCPSVADSCDDGSRWRFIVDVPDRYHKVHRIKMYSLVHPPTECIGQICLVYAHRTASDQKRLWGHFFPIVTDKRGNKTVLVPTTNYDIYELSVPLREFRPLLKYYRPDRRDR